MRHDNKSDHIHPHDELDRMLDNALARYTAVEPRPGMEDRVLATLRAEAAGAAGRVWWPWRMAAATVAAILLIVIALAFRSGGPLRPAIVQQAPTPEKVAPGPSQNIDAAKERPRSIRIQKPAKTLPRPARVEVAFSPRLDVFPSPRPLSEQEKILETFIQQYPKDAALIAEARMESLRQDQEEKQAQMESENKNSK